MYSRKTQQQYNTNTQREKKMQIKTLNTKYSIQTSNYIASYKTNIYFIFAEAIQESFSSLLQSQKNSIFVLMLDIFFYLEKEYGLIKENIPKNIEKFVNILENKFGPRAKLAEIKIMELIHNKLNILIIHLKTTIFFLKNTSGHYAQQYRTS